MALVSLQEVRVSFGGLPVLDGARLQLEGEERVALVGRNGAGKSTLMKVINGELAPGTGQVVRAPGLRSARLDQEIPADLRGTVAAVVAGGLEPGLPEPAPARQRVDNVLTRMQLDPDADVTGLCGGMQRRVLLARALVADPHVLLLDEPTNHLDIQAIRWLEDLLLRFGGTVVCVTHDRALLCRLATRIVEVDRGRLHSYSCPYAQFRQRRQARLAAEEAANAVFDKHLAQEEAWIRQGIQARRTRNEGRVKALERRREEHRARRQVSGTARLQVQEAARSGRLLIEAQDISFAYGDAPLIRDFSTLVMRGDRVGVVGPNGSGKTTLLRLLLGELAPLSGHVRLGTGLQVVYFDQRREQLDPERSVAENVAEGREFVTIGGKRRHVHGYLQDFLFTLDRARTPVRVLSGGERNRLLLARLFSRPANLLVLDEPTNDLDVETLELLEERLQTYHGTLLLVSHDRTFLDNVVTDLLVLPGDGLVHAFVGGYCDYLAQQREAEAAQAPAQPRSVAPPVRRERVRPRRLSFAEQRELEALPARIEALEGEQGEVHRRLADPTLYQQPGPQIAAVQARLRELEADLAGAYARWEELAAVGG
ncbi:MAG: ATP-binding cassette domain-containing protein [Candidatus Latescibacterota bacterium]